MNRKRFLIEHFRQTRRYFIGIGAAGFAALNSRTLLAVEERGEQQLQAELRNLDAWLTAQDKFQDVSRGNPKPHSLPDEKRKAVGLTRETWKLEVVSDPEHPSRLRSPLTAADGTALDFPALMEIARSRDPAPCVFPRS